MKRLVIPGLLLILAWLSTDCYASESDVELKIKAGYLYNFTKFVKWPPLSSQTFNICIAGIDPFGPIIDIIETKTALNRPIKVFRLGGNEILGSLNLEVNCHILYVNGLLKPSILADLMHPQIVRDASLIVGESEQFVAQGGMIGFVQREGKIKVHINLLAAKQAGLRISAKLLEVAEHIKARP